MRWSEMHIPTLRDDPADAEAASHRLLLRAGYVRQVMSGHYALLPLGVRTRQKVVQIIREEINGIGGQELLLPALHPAEVWRRTGRWESMGEEMFRLKDRKGADLALGMTHEEIFALLASDLRSYRDLPQIWYQFQTKFRDEPRPKGGLLRVREFTMKDSYSFDLDEDGLDRAFTLHHEAYTRIFSRLGIPAFPVAASSGNMGGSSSVEFMCPSDAGEDLVVQCPSCGYAANTEKAIAGLVPINDGPGLPAPDPFDTPTSRTIEDLTRQHDVPATSQIKTLVYLVNNTLTLLLLRGDHPLAEEKLAGITGATSLRPATPEEIRAALGASPGSLGAVGITDIPILADKALQDRRDLCTGANKNGVHLRGVDIARDIRVEQWVDLREARAGDPCAHCQTPLTTIRVIEVGHIFKLGRTYAEALNASVLNPEGKPTTLVMGSYGIGVERALAAIVECSHDEAGIIWPLATAPFAVTIIALQPRDPEVMRTSEEIYQQLQAAGIETILDDRKERPGVKFRDTELVGIPYRITVSSKGLAQNTVEITPRSNGETQLVPPQTAPGHLVPLLMNWG